MAKVFYKRALEQLAPMVGGAKLLEGDPWLVIDNARDEIVALRAEVAKLKAELGEALDESVGLTCSRTCEGGEVMSVKKLTSTIDRLRDKLIGQCRSGPDGFDTRAGSVSAWDGHGPYLVTLRIERVEEEGKP